MINLCRGTCRHGPSNEVVATTRALQGYCTTRWSSIDTTLLGIFWHSNGFFRRTLGPTYLRFCIPTLQNFNNNSMHSKIMISLGHQINHVLLLAKSWTAHIMYPTLKWKLWRFVLPYTLLLIIEAYGNKYKFSIPKFHDSKILVH